MQKNEQKLQSQQENAELTELLKKLSTEKRLNRKSKLSLLCTTCLPCGVLPLLLQILAPVEGMGRIDLPGMLQGVTCIECVTRKPFVPNAAFFSQNIPFLARRLPTAIFFNVD